MTQFKHVMAELERTAPLPYQESYDNSGLIVGERDQEITGVLVSLDCTEEIIDEAVEKGCNLVVAHHPIVFSGLKQLNGKNYVERTVIKAIRNNVGIYAIHTNLDNVSNGVNNKIADRIGLVDRKILRPKKALLTKLVVFCPKDHADTVRQAIFDAGAGEIGDYDQCSFNLEGTGTFRGGADTDPFVGQKNELHREPEIRIETIVPNVRTSTVVKAMIEAHPYEEVAYDLYPLQNAFDQVGSGMIGSLEQPMDTMSFLRSLKSKLETACVRYTPLVKEQVQRIAVCGGSGSFLIPDAIGAGADVFITGDVKYHQFFDAEDHLMIADVGHYESEQFTKELIIDLLKKKFTNFAIHFSEKNTNPINYL